MERRDKIIITLLARIAGHLEGIPSDEILAAVMDATAPKEKAEAQKPDPDVVERIYKFYPTKCPVSGRPLGKCSKDKAKIATLLKTRTAEDIELTIREYIVDCKNHNTYLKNFGTLLNNLPEREEPKAPAPAQTPPTQTEKRPPELMAIDAMHQGVTDANVVRQGILMVWGDTISEDTINRALYNAGYI